MLRRQDHDYFLDILGPNEFNAAVRFAARHGESAYKVLKSAVKSVTRASTSAGLRSRADRNINLGGEDYTRQYQGAKRDREGNVLEVQPKKLNFDVPNKPMMGDDINFSRSTARLGRVKKRTASQMFKAEIGAMDEQVWRWQRVSDNLLGPGATGISFGQNPAQADPDAAGTFVLPFHVMSLTHNPSFGEIPLLGMVKCGMNRFVIRKPMVPIETFQGHLGLQRLIPQMETGNYSSLPGWQIEKGVSSGANSQVFHKWTDIRLNLYGSRLYPLDYTITVVTGLPVEMQFLEHHPVSETVNSAPGPGDFPISDVGPLQQMIVDKVRKFITNPIVGSNTEKHYKGKYKTLYSKKVHVPCLSYGDGAAEASSTINATNVRSETIFLRHDRYRNYKWYTNAAYIEENDNVDGVGWTQTDNGAVGSIDGYCDVDREKRVFLILTCSCPTPILDATNNVAGPEFSAEVPQDAARLYDGSYDIVVRNCFRSTEGD